MLQATFVLSLCYQRYAKSYERIALTFYTGVWDGSKNK